MLRISLGTYGYEEACRIRDKFNAQKKKLKKNKNSYTLKTARIEFRARGLRNLWTRGKDGSFRHIHGSHTDISLRYAQAIAVYILIPTKGGFA